MDNNESLIETDIIPVGTFFNQKTFSSIEFKLDQPMTSGDSISVYARQSLSDNYQLVGTTSTAVLSSSVQSIAFEKWQWLQLKITTSTGGSPTTSSRVRLREIRIHQ